MTRFALAALALATLTAAAHARPEYDRSIDQSAARIVAGKMGELRGSFGIDEKPRMTPAIDATRTALADSRGSRLHPALDLRFVVPVAH